MINGPGNVWVERGGRARAPSRRRRLTAACAPPGGHPHRAPARARSGHRQAHPRRAARRRLPGRHLHSAGQPPRGDDDPPVRGPRVLGSRTSSAHGRPPRDGVPRCPEGPAWPPGRNILVSGGTGSGKTTLLNALIELLPEDERIVAIEDTLELRIERANCLRFEAGAVGSEALRVDPRPGAARAPPPARPHRRRRGAGAARPPTSSRR